MYIRGHSLPGVGTVGLPAKEGMSSELGGEEVAKRLQTSGLRPIFAGKIKCYNCHSGEAGEYSFAQQLADAMWEIGYRSCTYFGYEGALDSYPGLADAAHLQGHRSSDSKVSGKLMARASEVRRPFVPHQVMSDDAKKNEYLNRLSATERGKYNKKESLFPEGKLVWGGDPHS